MQCPFILLFVVDSVPVLPPRSRSSLLLRLELSSSGMGLSQRPVDPKKDDDEMATKPLTNEIRMKSAFILLAAQTPIRNRNNQCVQ